MSESQKRIEVAEYARRLHARGWVANHDGNVTLRLDENRFLATPTATSKAAIGAEDILVVDESGARVSGRGKPFGEIGLHLTVYRNRADVNAVVHAHPPTATGFAVAGIPLDQPMIAEAVVSLGVGIPTVPFAAPGAAACQALAPFVVAHDAVLLAGHGALAWGADLEQAYLRLELVEHLARVALVAHQLGGVRPIPQAVIPALLESRRKAGLGAAASLAPASGPPPSAPASVAVPSAVARPSSAPKTVVACAPAPPGSDVQVYEKPRAAVLPSPADLATIIRQEIAAALKK
jgi:L-fuculose-phosphate aldolase